MIVPTEHGFDADRQAAPTLARLAELCAYPARAWRHRELVQNFFRREFHGRFRGSMLGIIWVLVHPLFLFATFYLVFGFMFQMRAPEGAHEFWYPFYLFTGVLAWTVFAETAMRSTNLVLENGNLIQKVAFPAELLPIHIAAVNLIVYCVGIAAYLVIAFVLSFTSSGEGIVVPGANLCFLPLVLAVQLVFTVGFGLFLGAANVFLRDVNQIFPILAQLWFFATPVFWYPAMFALPDGTNRLDPLMPLLKLNPMLHILGAHRTILGLNPGGAGDVLRQCGIAAVPAALVFAAGYLFFRGLERRFADEV